MNKEQFINNVLADMSDYLTSESMIRLKIVLSVRLENHNITEEKALPSTEVCDNQWLMQRFLVDTLAKGSAKSTAKAYLFSVRKFFDATGLTYKQVTGQHITDYLARMQYERNNKGGLNTINYVASQCRNLCIFFDWAYRKEHIENSVTKNVDRIKARQKKIECLTPDQIVSCRESLKSDREKALFELMLSTGMRVGEICQLKVSDLHFDTCRVDIHGYKTESAERIGILTPEAKWALQKYVGNRTSGYLFKAQRGKKLEHVTTKSIETIAKRIGERAGVPTTTTVHLYRKTFATGMYRKMSDLKAVAYLLGHKNTSTTDGYYIKTDLKQIEARIYGL